MPELRLPALAPETLTQSILPWTWMTQLTGLEYRQYNIYMGHSSNPELEREILDKVGTYGRQIGQIGDALAVVMDRVDLSGLQQDQQDAIDALREQLAAVARLKRQAAAEKAAAAQPG